MKFLIVAIFSWLLWIVNIIVAIMLGLDGKKNLAIIVIFMSVLFSTQGFIAYSFYKNRKNRII